MVDAKHVGQHEPGTCIRCFEYMHKNDNVTPIGQPIRDAEALADALDTWLDRVVALAMKGKQSGDDGDRRSSDLYASAVLERIGALGPDATRMILTALVSKHADLTHACHVAGVTAR